MLGIETVIITVIIMIVPIIGIRMIIPIIGIVADLRVNLQNQLLKGFGP
jgi:hypothetical protein